MLFDSVNLFMRSKISAGILLYRKRLDELEVFLVHPGGPFWKNKDEGAWSIPKGENDSVGSGNDTLFDVARREFFEETSFRIEDCCKGELIELTPVKLKSGKIVYAWAVEGDIDAKKIVSNTILIEWPPNSKKQLEIPEVDKGAWFTIEEGKKQINLGQVPLLQELATLLAQG